jgi:pyruvate dehydrogenase E1 component alpha subunit
MGGHRAHGHYLAKGGDLRAMVAELHGRATGCCRGKGGSMHLIDLRAGFLGAVPIVGSTISIAVGAAFGTHLAGEDRVTVAFFGEGATEEGVFAESLNFARLHRLPVVFVVENNGYSVYSPLSVRQPPERDLLMIARGHGLVAARGDGQDPLEVHALASEAVARARAGEGPTLLEFPTYRWLEHCGPFDDDALGYRPAGELRAWQARCCVAALERRLLAAGALDAEEIAAQRRALAAEADDALEFARRSPWPEQAELLRDVYGAGSPG